MDFNIYDKMDYKIFDNMVFRRSTRKNKKYDVYNMDGKYLTSFGDKRYQQYHDKLGFYSHLDHNDKDRRERYLNRHSKDKQLAGTLARYLLWIAVAVSLF